VSEIFTWLDNGFAIVVALFVLVRLESKLEKITDTLMDMVKEMKRSNGDG